MACRFSELVIDCRDPEAMAAFDLGAVPADVGQSGDEGWHVLADPEDNPFCLLRRRLAPL
jgi:hypothetical protein